MNRNLVRSIYGISSIEITHFILLHLQTWLPQAIPVLDWSISKNLLIWNCFAKMNRYEGSVLSFLKAEWKVSDTGSAHWASSILTCLFVFNVTRQQEINILYLLLCAINIIFSKLCYCRTMMIHLPCRIYNTFSTYSKLHRWCNG